MTPQRKMLRAFKIFGIATAIVFTVLNAPLLYSEARYLITRIVPTADDADAAGSVIKPLKLPISQYVPPPLPDQATLAIEKIGVSAVPIVFSVNENNFEEMYNRLNEGVVHYSATVKPGMKGVAAILGHSSDYAWKMNPYGTVFSLLGKLAPGDKFSVSYFDGRTFTFAVRETFIFDPMKDDDSRLASLEDNSKPVVLLITCWPINSTAKRLIVKAEAI